MFDENPEVSVLPHLWKTEEKWKLVERVSNSETFQKSPRLREFFLYAAECTLNNRPEDAREQQIALKVFNRKPDSNLGQDTIVRVEARLLRKRLETYFGSEGKDIPLLISMPKGSYSLTFEQRPPTVVDGESHSHASNEKDVPEEKTATVIHLDAIDDTSAIQLETAGPNTIVPATNHHIGMGTPFWIFLTMTLVALAIGAALLLVRGKAQSDSTLSVRKLPLGALIDASKDTEIVTADASLVVLRELSSGRIGLQEYMT